MLMLYCVQISAVFCLIKCIVVENISSLISIRSHCEKGCFTLGILLGNAENKKILETLQSV